MGNGKPFTEVLTALFVNELHQLDPATVSDWESMGTGSKRKYMGAMAEVVRTINAFGLEVRQEDGKIFLARIQQPAPQTPRPESVRMPSSAVLMDRQKVPGYTGIPCDNCGSPNTLRTGKCLRCAPPPLGCGQDGECG